MNENLRKLNEKELNNKNINNLYIKEKNILNKEIYLEIQALYQKALDYYILNFSSIKKYNDIIKNSNLSFGLIDEKMKSPYHKISNLNLEYIYIRNFLYIEKLELNQLSYIYKKIINNDFSIDNELLDIVKNTYKSVINDNFRHGKYKENTNTCYGHLIPNNIVKSDNLVFCIHYGKNIKKMLKDEYLENSKLKRDFLFNLVNQMEEEISKELNINVKVLIRKYVGE